MEEKIYKGLKVEIGFADCPVSMVGTILQVDSQTLVVSLVPDEDQGGPVAPLPPVSGVQVVATAEDALYRFTSTLLHSSGLLFYLTPPAEVQRVQRREHVRERCLLDAEFVMPGNNGAPIQRTQATAVSISCGGLLLVYEGRVEVGDPVEVSVRLPQGGPPLQAAGIVVRTEPFSRLGRDLSRVAVRLVDLKASDERRILQFVMGLQVRAARGTVWGSRPLFASRHLRHGGGR